jgi:hypothetical protein
MWWPGPWDRAVRFGWLLFDLAMTTMHRPRSVDCQVLIHWRSVGPRCSSTSVLRLIGGGVGVEGNGEALSAQISPCTRYARRKGDGDSVLLAMLGIPPTLAAQMC